MCCESTRRALVNFRLKTCCCLTSVKVGINIIAYFNVLVSFISLLSEGKFSPIALEVQNLMSSEGTAVPRLANIAEILFNILLLIAVNKKISALLLIFIYYCVAKISVMAIVLWPILNASEDDGLPIIITTAVIILFQLYMTLLVRSVIVEINIELAELNGKEIQIVFIQNKQEDKEATVEIKMDADYKSENPKKEDEETKSVEATTSETKIDLKRDKP